MNVHSRLLTIWASIGIIDGVTETFIGQVLVFIGLIMSFVFTLITSARNSRQSEELLDKQTNLIVSKLKLAQLEAAAEVKNELLRAQADAVVAAAELQRSMDVAATKISTKVDKGVAAAGAAFITGNNNQQKFKEVIGHLSTVQNLAIKNRVDIDKLRDASLDEGKFTGRREGDPSD